MTPEAHILTRLADCFPNRKIDGTCLKLVHKGRFANALVFRYTDNFLDLTIKDFSHCPLLIRNTFGRICISREFSVLSQLNGLPGISPSVFRLAPLTVAYEYIEGRSLSDTAETGEKLPPEFFLEMEKRIAGMHSRGLVHLDLRNMGNILEGIDGQPYFIDFQSALPLKYVPAFLRNLLRDTDRSAACKSWKRCCSEPLPEEKKQFFEAFNRKRKFWILKGYPGRKIWEKYFSKKNTPKPIPTEVQFRENGFAEKSENEEIAAHAKSA